MAFLSANSASDAEDSVRDQIKYIPALVILIMFASVVFGVRTLRKEPLDKPQVIFVQGEPGEGDHETLPADSLFDFDKATLKPDAAERIRKFAVRAKALDKSRVVVIGHTDALGSERHNDSLSTARAEAVREVLVGEGLDHTMVVATGVGARIPVKKREACPGAARDPKVIACLEPNRRVEFWAKKIEAQ